MEAEYSCPDRYEGRSEIKKRALYQGPFLFSNFLDKVLT